MVAGPVAEQRAQVGQLFGLRGGLRLHVDGGAGGVAGEGAADLVCGGEDEGGFGGWVGGVGGGGAG